MEIRERTIGVVPVLELEGRMVQDEDDDNPLKERIGELVSRGHRHIVLDVARVDQVDTSGLTALVAGHVRASRAGALITLVNTPTRLRELLRRTRLNTLFEVRERERDAVDVGGGR